MFQTVLAVIYLAFISLGLPDGLLGAAWPKIYVDFAVPVSYAGIISAIISCGTIVSSLQSDRLTLKYGTGKVTAVSVLITAAALLGFSITHSFWVLCLWAVPYGLGAGSVDASLNNYVALHYESRHMSWLHCMWGIGAATGPYIMGWALTNGRGWNAGYRVVGLIQIVLTLILFLSLPKWQKRNADASENEDQKRKPQSLKSVLQIRGAKEIMVCFFCYCAVEQTTGLWAASYLTLYKGLSADLSASFASMFYIGITIGRAISGFLTIRLSDVKMVRLGQSLILAGVVVMLVPAGPFVSLAAFIMIGLGCAPIYPCIIHSTPEHFGKDKSQAVIGMQMAFAYVGTLAMPPLFGVLANLIDIALLPYYLVVLLALMFVMHETLVRKTAQK